MTRLQLKRPTSSANRSKGKSRSCSLPAAVFCVTWLLKALLCRVARPLARGVVLIVRSRAFPFATGGRRFDQDCFGCVRYPGDNDRSAIAYTVELIEVSHREMAGSRAP